MARIHFDNFNIAGFSYHEGPIIFHELEIGTELRLVVEDNFHDENAVAIYYKDSKIGFVPKTDNYPISKLIRAGYNIFEVRIQQLKPTGHPEEQVRVIVYILSKESEEKSKVEII